MQMMAPEAAAAQHGNPVARGKEAGIASYKTQEGSLMLGAFRPAQYRRLATMLDALGHAVPALAQVQDWADVWALGEDTKALLCGIFLTADADTWVRRLRAADLPAERVKTLAVAVALPQLAARGYFQPSPDDSATALPTSAFHMGGAAATLRQPPPTLGQHSRAILSDIGLDQDKIDHLFGAGIVA